MIEPSLRTKATLIRRRSRPGQTLANPTPFWVPSEFLTKESSDAFDYQRPFCSDGDD
jgi:hypothetical protein